MVACASDSSNAMPCCAESLSYGPYPDAKGLAVGQGVEDELTPQTRAGNHQVGATGADKFGMLTACRHDGGAVASRGFGRYCVGPGVVMRPRGGVRRPIADEEIVRLRDVERMAWADMVALTGLTDVSLKLRYDAALDRPVRYRWQRSGEQHPDLSPLRLTELNTVIDHSGEIVDDYLSGRASAMELSRTWGISDTTVRRWAACHQDQVEHDA